MHNGHMWYIEFEQKYTLHHKRINQNRKKIDIKKTEINGKLNNTVVLLPKGAEDAQRSQNI